MDVPELVPLDDYDVNQAKLEASVSWLIAKAYGRDVPSNLQEPFFFNQQDKLCCKDALVAALTSSQLYCQACTRLFSQQPTGHQGVIELLSRRGHYVVDVNESAVTEQILATQPIRVSAHLSVIDALMNAYTTELVTIERVVQTVRRFSTFSASSELPYDTEDALLFWLNKTCDAVRQRIERVYGRQDKENQGRHSRARQAPVLPFMHDLLKDIYDGCCLATTISFYCPTALNQHDIVMEESIRTADAMFNIQLVLEFCADQLPVKTCHLTLNDLFYTHHALKANLLVFLAELFLHLELQPISCVQPVTSAQPQTTPEQNHVLDAGPDEADSFEPIKQPGVRAQSAKYPTAAPPISDITKRSFHQPNTGSAWSPDIHASQQAAPPTRQPLLPKRLQQRTDSQERLADRPALQLQRQSVPAWQDDSSATTGSGRDQQHGSNSQSHPQHSALRGFIGARTAAINGTGEFESSSSHTLGSDILTGVSIDTESSVDVSSATSVTLTDMEDTPRGGQPTPPPTLQMNSGAGGNSLRDIYKKRGDEAVFQPSKPDGPEKLLPAQRRPAKEKSNIQSKGVESGEHTSPSSRRTRPTLNPRTAVIPSQPPPPQRVHPPSDSDDPSDSEFQTPSSESAPFFSVLDEAQSGGQSGSGKSSARGDSARSASGRGVPAAKQSARMPSTGSGSALGSADGRPGTGEGERSNTAQSFVLQDQYTEESARAAGIPVVQSGELAATGTPQRRQWNTVPPALFSDAASPRSCSSDGSDQELRKLNADTRENETKPASFFIINGGGNGEAPNRPDSLHIAKSNSAKIHNLKSKQQYQQTQQAPKTSFAQLQRERSVDKDTGKSGMDDSLHGSMTLSLKEQFDLSKVQTQQQQKQPNKKTTFAALPNQTTWSEFATQNQQKSTSPVSGPKALQTPCSSEGSDAQTPQAELLNIRMLLGESRRKIEQDKRRTELEANRQRQRVGKQAFMQVITKTKEDTDPNSLRDKRLIQKTVQEEDAIEKQTSHARKSSTDRVKSSPNQSTASAERAPSTYERSSSSERGGSERTPRASANSVQRSRSSIDGRAPRPVVDRRSPTAGDRASSKQEEKLQQLIQRLDSLETSPGVRAALAAEQEARAGGGGSGGSQRRSFSRENIQTAIDKAKRFLGSEEPVEYRNKNPASNGTGRPQSFAGERTAPMSPARRGRAGSEEPANVPENHLDGEYSSSLDKLNTSLTELQGEIMSLSLSNDQPAAAPPTHTPPRFPLRQGAPPSMAQSDDVLSQGIRDNFYLMPRPGEQQPLEQQVSRMSRSEPSPRQTGTPPRGEARQLQSPAAHNLPEGYRSPQVAQQHSPAMYDTPPHQQYAGQTPPQMQMPSHTEHYASPQTRARGDYSAQNHYAYVPQQNMFMNTMAMRSHSAPYNGTLPYSHNATGYVMTTAQGYVTSPPQELIMSQYEVHQQRTPGGANGMPVSQWGAPVPPPMLAQHQQFGHSPSPPPGHPRSPAVAHIPAVSSPRDTRRVEPAPPSGYGDFSGDNYSTGDIHMQQQQPVTQDYTAVHGFDRPEHASPQAQTDLGQTVGPEEPDNSETNHATDKTTDGFFIAFDDKPALKPRPKLGHERKANTPTPASSGKQTGSQSNLSSGAPPRFGAPSPAVGANPPVATSSPAHSTTSSGHSHGDVTSGPPPGYDIPAEAFIVPADELGENEELSDIERRRQKFLALQEQRKEESRKKHQLEQTRARMREQQSQKQAVAEARKAEEKTRREQIYNDYLKRKAERERQVQDARAGAAPVSRRAKAVKARAMVGRPKSQPALPADHFSTSSHSSTEDLRGRSPAPYHGGLPVHPDRAALFGLSSGSTSHLAMQPPSDMFDGPPNEAYSNLHRASHSPAPSGYHNNAVGAAGAGMGYGSLTQRRPPTPESGSGVMYRSQGDNTNNNVTAEYSGPKLFKKPSSKSNKQVVIQAISCCCLAGAVNTAVKDKVLEIINDSEACQFVILFRDGGQQFRALYKYNLDTEDISKIYGVGPKQITSKMMERFYKYNCGAKKFSQVTTTKHMSATIDAVCLFNVYWTKKAPAKKPPSGYC